jgi:hypothetical protein
MRRFVLKTAWEDGFGNLETFIIKTKFLGKFKLLIHALITSCGKRINQA